MSVAECIKCRSRKVARKVTLIVCSITIAVAAFTAVPTKSEAAIAVSGNDIARVAVSYLGTPYVLGGTSRQGLDCSGFVYVVLTQLGYTNVPRSTSGWRSAPALKWNGESVKVQTLDPTNPSYDAQPGDIITYEGHVAICMGRPGTWGQYSDIRSYVAAMGGNTRLVFETYSSWPSTSPWYRIHARSAAPNAQGRISGIEIDDTNFSSAGCYAIKAYRITDSSGNSNTVSKKPELKDVSISDVTSEGYTVTLQLTNASSVQSIALPTWTSANGQDDLKWYSAAVGNTVSYRVKTAMHNNEAGEYNTHIYINDKFGNTLFGAKTVNVPASNNQAAKPSIADVKFSDVNSSGYTVTVKLVNLSAITSLTFPTWTSANGQDDITWDTAKISGDTATYRVDVSRHNNEAGNYNTHIHLKDRAGNLIVAGGNVQVPAKTVSNKKPKITDFKVSNVNSSGYDVTVTIENAENVTDVFFPTWTDANGQDDITWERASVSGNKYNYHVNTSQHNRERGLYYTHIHVYDTSAGLLVDGRAVIVP